MPSIARQKNVQSRFCNCMRDSFSQSQFQFRDFQDPIFKHSKIPNINFKTEIPKFQITFNFHLPSGSSCQGLCRRLSMHSRGSTSRRRLNSSGMWWGNWRKSWQWWRNISIYLKCPNGELLSIDVHHEKTDHRVFVIVIPKEGWTRVAAPILLLA